MASLPSCRHRMLLLFLLLLVAIDQMAMASLHDDVEVVWGQDHSFFYMDGDDNNQTLALCLDETHGSGFHTKEAYLYARFDVDLMLVPNNSAGTVTTLYLMPEDVPWEYHDEVDLEFLGNVTGEPYTLHTNVFANGVGRREEQFRLWFDPTAAFHTYSIECVIRILVDGVPIRDFKNKAKHGVPFPTWQKMRLHGSLWNADDWATQGGRVKTDWAGAPFFAYYRNLRVSWCEPSPGVAWCGDEPPESTRFEQGLDVPALQKARDMHMIYDYLIMDAGPTSEPSNGSLKPAMAGGGLRNGIVAGSELNGVVVLRGYAQGRKRSQHRPSSGRPQPLPWVPLTSSIGD